MSFKFYIPILFYTMQSFASSSCYPSLDGHHLIIGATPVGKIYIISS